MSTILEILNIRRFIDDADINEINQKETYIQKNVQLIHILQGVSDDGIQCFYDTLNLLDQANIASFLLTG